MNVIHEIGRFTKVIKIIGAINPDSRCPADTILMPTVSAGHQNGVSIIRDRIKAIFYKFQFALMNYESLPLFFIKILIL